MKRKVLINRAILAIFCVILACSCELFNGAADPGYLDKLHEEIAWANAEKLIVTVGFPAEWGSSPQRGTGRCGDTRLGYPFQVEFGAMPGYGFEQWLAFYTDAYDGLDKSLTAAELKEFSRNDIDVFFEDIPTVSGSHTAKVIIKTKTPITLVPWCGDRPTIIQSNPPLIGSGFYYTRGQQIVLKFSMELIYKENSYIDKNGKHCLPFGENLIQIEGHDMSGNAWEGTGAFHDVFFDTPVYDPITQTIIITPKENNPPPEYYTITVTVGTEITGANGKTLSSPVKFSYRTSNEIVTRAFKANNIWAIHDLSNPHAGSFFYQMAPVERDRRLRKNGDNYEINLYFSVSRSVGEIADIDPDKVSIMRIHYADIRGMEKPIEDKPPMTVYTVYNDENGALEEMEEDTNSAGLIYQQMNNTMNPLGINFYKVKYTFPANTPNGIYRLVILPERIQPKQGEAVAADDWDRAVKEGRFVTVVIDNTVPNNSGNLVLNGHYSTSRGTHNYSLDRANRNLIINSNFSAFHDNDEHGIPLGVMLNNATPNKPWTRDEPKNLQWQWRIVHYITPDDNTNIFSYIHESNWMQMEVNPPPLDLSSSTTIYNQNIIWLVEVQFRNGLGYESGWTEKARIRYSPPIRSAIIEHWNVQYSENETNGIITISWENWDRPSDVTAVRVNLSKNIGNNQKVPIELAPDNPLNKIDLDVTGSSVTINNINIEKHNDSFSNITEYTITLQSLFGPILDSDSLIESSIWNITGMKITNGIMENSFVVNNFNDVTNNATQGTLRFALARAQAGNRIVLCGVIPGESEIVLLNPLPEITRGINIYGNGITITRFQSGWISNANSQLLRINNPADPVNISRVHFKDGLASDNGAAIFKNGGILNLESCIFSGNETTASGANGGAIRNTGNLTINGCTFYNNSAANGAAISSASGTITLKGNVFNFNTASGNGRIVQGGTITTQNNVYDAHSGNADHRIGFPAGTTGNISIPSVPFISSSNFRPLNFTGGAVSALTLRPSDYPTADFYGASIPESNINAGAVQQTTASGTVYVIIDATESAANLQTAFTYVQDGDVIAFSNVTPGTSNIELIEALPVITKDITIEGNGITITRSGSSNFRLITKDSGNVTIRRVHFKGGRAESEHGGAIRNNGGNLVLESCIFSDNQTADTSGYGGAIYNEADITLIIRGCTFYKNHANWGGAISVNNGSINITGNIFYENTVPGTGGMPVVNRGERNITSSYNVVDYHHGSNTQNAYSGFTAGTGGRSIPSVPLIATATGANHLNPHNFAGGALDAVPVLTSRPSGYPTIDFYGNPIPAGTAYAGASQTGVTASSRYLIIDATQTEDNRRTAFRNVISSGNTGDIIAFSNVTPGTTIITFTNTQLLHITRNMTIYGNGIILQGPGGSGGNNFTWGSPSNVTTTSQLLRIGTSSTRPTVTIERVHFRGGRASQSGAAISNWGTVTLRSCIFSNNHVWMDNWESHGGAIRNEDGSTMYVYGCTFFGNVVRGSGGAIGAAIHNTGHLFIMGNIFYGNNSFSNNHHIIYGGDTWGSRSFTSYGYNILDRWVDNNVNFTHGYPLHNDDARLYTLSWGFGSNIVTNPSGDNNFMFGSSGGIDVFSRTNLTFVPNNINITRAGGGNRELLTYVPAGWTSAMSATDFYGRPRVWPGAPGAVRQP
ncbi:MAG: hypothetical protein FWD13_01205 [Treponema sp.]|nr:hypothetical protein [Treponema sp.]